MPQCKGRRRKRPFQMMINFVGCAEVENVGKYMGGCYVLQLNLHVKQKLKWGMPKNDII